MNFMNKCAFIEGPILRDFGSYSFSCDITVSPVHGSAPSCVVSKIEKEIENLKKKKHI